MGAFTKIKSSTGGIAFSFSKRIGKRKSYRYLRGSKWGTGFCNIALRVALLLFLYLKTLDVRKSFSESKTPGVQDPGAFN